jgi:hypothetical protein
MHAVSWAIGDMIQDGGGFFWHNIAISAGGWLNLNL